jgi:hypothetical protein
MVGLDFD